MINATRPFGYPLSKTESALRPRRGVVRLMMKGESRQPLGNCICEHYISLRQDIPAYLVNW